MEKQKWRERLKNKWLNVRQEVVYMKVPKCTEIMKERNLVGEGIKLDGW
jgi:hypothetical protein